MPKLENKSIGRGSVQTGLRHLLAVIKSEPFGKAAGFQAATVLMQLGVEWFRVGLAWHLLAKGGSSALLGAIVVTMTAIQIPSRLLVSGLAERIDPIKIVRNTVLVQALAAGALAYLSSRSVTSGFLYLACAALLGLCSGLREPLIVSSFPRLVPNEKVSSAIAMRGALSSTVSMLGPLTGAALVAIFDAGVAMVFAVATIAGAGTAYILVARALPPTSLTEKKHYPLRRLFTEPVASLVTLIQVRLDFLLCLVCCAINLVLPPFFQILLPSFVVTVRELSPQALGFIDGAFAAGMVIGGTWGINALNRRLGKHRTLSIGVLLVGLMLLAFPYIHSLPLLGLLMLVSGVGMTAIFVNVSTLRAIATPEAHRVRLFAAASFLGAATIPLGSAFMTWLSVATSVSTAIGVAGVTVVGSAVLIGLIPRANEALSMPTDEAKGLYARWYPNAFQRSGK